MQGVYKIVNKITGKFYIGKSTNITKRFNRHVRELRKGIHHCMYLQRAWNKYGEENFSFEIVAECKPEMATQLEQDYLDYFRPLLYNMSYQSTGGDLISYHPKRDEIVSKMKHTLAHYYSNLTEQERCEKYGLKGEKNGMYGRTHTDETKQKLSAMNKGNQYAKGSKRSKEQRQLLSELASQRTGERNPFYGRTHTKESKDKIREKLKGRMPINAQRVIIDGTVYESATQAAKALGIATATVFNRIKSDKFPNYTRG